jgi:hypothetical protein
VVALCPEPALAQRHCLDLAGWPGPIIAAAAHARAPADRVARGQAHGAAAWLPPPWRARGRGSPPPPATEGDGRSAPRRTATAWPACQPAWSGQGELLGAGAAERAWDWDRKTTCAVRGTAACTRHGGRSHPPIHWPLRPRLVPVVLWFPSTAADPTHPSTRLVRVRCGIDS